MNTQDIITICFVITTGMGLIGVYIKLIKTIDNQEKLLEGINQRLSTVEYNQRNKLEIVADMKDKLSMLANTVDSHKSSISEQQTTIQKLDKYTTQIFERLKSISENQLEIKETVKSINDSIKSTPKRNTK
ncbi:MAG: hypothetical protein U0Y10_17760 [Spirosomataceae bacterium]